MRPFFLDRKKSPAQQRAGASATRCAALAALGGLGASLIAVGTAFGQTSASPPSAPVAPAPPSAPPTGPTQTQQAPDVPQEKVEVFGVKSDTQQRRESTAAKIVIGREEIERYGDSTLDEVLKRLPSISIQGRTRRGGNIVMRGMGAGYTQILINGERIPPGFSIDQIMPDQVERIEIYRAPTAETGTRAIAGTINIVLREALRRYINEVRLQLGDEAGRGQTNFSWIRNDVMGERSTYNVTLSFAQVDFFTPLLTQRIFTQIGSQQTLLDQNINTDEIDRRDNLHFTSRFQWHLESGDQLVIQPFFTLSKTQTQISGTLDQTAGLEPEPYATSLSDGGAHSALARVQAQLTHQLGDGDKVEIHGSIGGFSSDTDALLDETASNGAIVLRQASETDISDLSWTTTGKLTYHIGGGHDLVTGLEAEGINRSENASTIQNGEQILTGFGENISASVLRTAAYIQDDWSPAPHWAAEVGLRWEGITTQSDERAQQVSNISDVLDPIAHAVWRFDEPDRDQLRISLTTSYRAPSLNSLIGLPTVNTLYPVSGGNVESAPDTVGNPHLKPELARGIDVALEHYDFKDGVMSISVFDRQIHDMIRNNTFLEAVPYSPVERWVSEPVNFADASTQGIEMDAKFRLDSVIKDAIPLLLNANASIYHSTVAGVLGPYNHINQQPRAQANLGADYTFHSAPVEIGANVSWIPPYTITTLNTLSTYYGLKRQIDTYALWTLSPELKIRFSITNALPVDFVNDATTTQGSELQRVLTSGRTTTLYGVRMEWKI